MTSFLVDRVIIQCKMHCSTQQNHRWENFCEEKASFWSQQIQLITSSETGTLYVSWGSSLLYWDNMSQIQLCPSPFWMSWLLHTADHLPHNSYFGLCTGFYSHLKQLSLQRCPRGDYAAVPYIHILLSHGFPVPPGAHTDVSTFCKMVTLPWVIVSTIGTALWKNSSFKICLVASIGD